MLEQTGTSKSNPQQIIEVCNTLGWVGGQSLSSKFLAFQGGPGLVRFDCDSHMQRFERFQFPVPT